MTEETENKENKNVKNCSSVKKKRKKYKKFGPKVLEETLSIEQWKNEPWRFKPKYHDDCARIAFEVLKNSGTILDVLCELGISDATFYTWKQQYEEFRNAVSAGMPHSRRSHKNLGKQLVCDKNAQANIYSYIGRHYYKTENLETFSLKGIASAETYEEKVNILFAALESGDLTELQAEKLINIVVGWAQMKQATETQAQVHEIQQLLKDKESNK